MLILKTNRLGIFGRIVGLLLLSTVQYIIIKKEIIDGEIEKGKPVALLYIMAALLTFVLILIICSFFQILKVEVNKLTGEIRFRRLFSTLTIYKDDIAGYYSVTYQGSRAKLWRGLLVKTSKNKSFRLMEQNLKSVQELQQYFEQENLKRLGEKRRFFFNEKK
jgi:hypothetical protein